MDLEDYLILWNISKMYSLRFSGTLMENCIVACRGELSRPQVLWAAVNRTWTFKSAFIQSGIQSKMWLYQAISWWKLEDGCIGAWPLYQGDLCYVHPHWPCHVRHHPLPRGPGWAYRAQAVDKREDCEGNWDQVRHRNQELSHSTYEKKFSLWYCYHQFRFDDLRQQSCRSCKEKTQL